MIDQGKVETETSIPKTKYKKVTSPRASTQKKIDVRALQGLLFLNFQKTDPNTSTFCWLLTHETVFQLKKLRVCVLHFNCNSVLSESTINDYIIVLLKILFHQWSSCNFVRLTITSVITWHFLRQCMDQIGIENTNSWTCYGYESQRSNFLLRIT